MTAETLKPGLEIKPKMALEDVETIVNRFYDLKVSKVDQLPGYDDLNFKVATETGRKFVLKIMNSLDSQNPQFVEAMNELQLFLDKKEFKLPVPAITKESAFHAIIELSSGRHVVRLMTYVEGRTLLEAKPKEPEFYRKLGAFLAHLDEAMKGFSHPSFSSRSSLWQLDQVPSLRNFLHALSNEPERRRVVEAIIDEFERRVLTESTDLSSGLIHGDFNEQNVLVLDDNERLAILDFGDAARGRYLFELAIAMAYVAVLTQSLDAPGYLLAGYGTVRAVPEFERRLLKICIMARLCQSLVMGAYTIARDPLNHYVMSTAQFGWKILDQIRKIPEQELLESWSRICTKS